MGCHDADFNAQMIEYPIRALIRWPRSSNRSLCDSTRLRLNEVDFVHPKILFVKVDGRITSDLDDSDISSEFCFFELVLVLN